jgi:phosphoenolpyruvate carboxykinase (ATP)
MTMPKKHLELEKLGLRNLREIYHQLSVSELYEHALRNKEAVLSADGAIVATTGAYTGRSPKDRFIVREPSTENDIWWGKINQPIEPEQFGWVFQKMQAFFKGRDVYVQDCYAGADDNYRLPVRVITEMAWHNLFAQHMFINPPVEDLDHFEPAYTIIQAPNFTSNPETDGTRSETFIFINFAKKLILIGGTHYTGEIKKSIFGIMNYLMPHAGVLPMHCSANVGDDGGVAIFFGLSGTGKTTLSSDSTRVLIGDDEHGWGADGVFNFEGGCYAKAINLSAEGEPEIYQTTKMFGSILENVILDKNRRPDFDDDRLTQNTRCTYPIVFIPNASDTGLGAHPKNVIFLTADAFGVLPPVSRLTPEQAAYHFLNGYTAKVAGTERGVVEPQTTFSACFGEPFMPLHPARYAEMLSDRIRKHNVNVWLINTGWTGGGYGVGKRMNLAYTRRMVNAILDGSLAEVATEQETFFGLRVPVACPGVPSEILDPRKTWVNKAEYDDAAIALAERFRENYQRFAEQELSEIVSIVA